MLSSAPPDPHVAVCRDSPLNSRQYIVVEKMQLLCNLFPSGFSVLRTPGMDLCWQRLIETLDKFGPCVPKEDLLWGLAVGKETE